MKPGCASLNESEGNSASLVGTGISLKEIGMCACWFAADPNDSNGSHWYDTSSGGPRFRSRLWHFHPFVSLKFLLCIDYYSNSTTVLAMASVWECPCGGHSYMELEVELWKVFQLPMKMLSDTTQPILIR